MFDRNKLILSAAQDKRLSWDARGALAFILTQPPGWKINVPDLIAATSSASMRSSSSVVYRVLRELREVGYLTRNKVGRGGIEYILHDAAPAIEVTTAEAL